MAEVVGEFGWSGSIESEREDGGGIDHEDVAIDGDFAGIGDADLWILELDSGVGFPISVVAFGDFDINASFESF